MNKELTNPEFQLPILPDHLIMEQILPRLPVKSLIRFKSVSKPWLFTISSYEFHMTHLKFSSSINRNQTLILRKWLAFHVAYYFALDKWFNSKEFVELEFKFPSPNNLPRGLGYVDVVDSCNGLVCFLEFNGSFFLWNPATNQCRNVSHPDFGYSEVLLDEVSCSGFAYVSSIDDYIIACLVTFEEYVCYYFFSMRAGKWITIDKLDELDIFQLCYRFGYAIDDTMYWPPEKDVTIGSHIVAVNLVGGQLRKIPLINFGIDYSHARVSEINGCLSLYCMYSTDTHFLRDCDVWMLKQLDNLDSWEKMFTIRHGFSKLLYIYGTGECLVARREGVLMLYSPTQVAPKQYEEGNVIWHTSEQINKVNRIHVRGYVESLISPFRNPGYEDDNETQE